jgi:hypothetical protein
MTQFGSLINALSAGPSSIEPEIGMGVTFLQWSDRSPGTILYIERFKTGAKAGQVKMLLIQTDTATRIDTNGQSDAQSYDITPNPNGNIIRAKWTTKGFRTASGTAVRIGSRDMYYDYSF